MAVSTTQSIWRSGGGDQTRQAYCGSGVMAATSTLAMRIVDVVSASATDAYPDIIVKFNMGVHSYTNSLGV